MDEPRCGLVREEFRIEEKARTWEKFWLNKFVTFFFKNEKSYFPQKGKELGFFYFRFLLKINATATITITITTTAAII